MEHQSQFSVGGEEDDVCCVITCCAMLLNYYGADITAKEIYHANGAYAYYDAIKVIAGMQKKVEFEQSDSISETDVFKKCVEELKYGNPVMVEIAYNNKNGSGVHSVVIYGMTGDGTKASDFLAMDPYRKTADNPRTNKPNTLQDSYNMLGYATASRWRIYRPLD